MKKNNGERVEKTAKERWKEQQRKSYSFKNLTENEKWTDQGNQINGNVNDYSQRFYWVRCVR